MTALDTPITLPAIRRGLVIAWRWWIGELGAMVPEAIKRRIVRASPVYDLYLTADMAEVACEQGEGMRAVVRLDWQANPVDRVESGQAPSFRAPQGARARVRIGSSFAIRREFELPATAERRLRSIVALDLDRQTPFPAGAAEFDVQVVARDPDASRIRVAVSAIRRETLGKALLLCDRLGLKPLAIETAGSVSDPRPFNFLLRKGAELPRRFRFRLGVILTAAIVLLIGLNIGLQFSRLDGQLAGLEAELTKVRKEAQGAEKLRAQLAQAQSESKLLGDVHERVAALEALQALTQTLPDDVWLFELELGNGSGQIAGYAPSAADLLDRLDKSGVFVNPRFKAAITRADKGDQDRFEIGFDLAPGTSK